MALTGESLRVYNILSTHFDGIIPFPSFTAKYNCAKEIAGEPLIDDEIAAAKRFIDQEIGCS